MTVDSKQKFIIREIAIYAFFAISFSIPSYAVAQGVVGPNTTPVSPATYPTPSTQIPTSNSINEVEYKLLEPGIPAITVEEGTKATASSVLNGFLQLAIGGAGVLAVLMIMYGGLQYLTASSGMTKTTGKETIKKALIGFGFAIAAWAILNTVNPQLTDLKLELKGLEIGGNAPGGIIGTPPDLQPCANCVPVPSSLPQKSPAPSNPPPPGYGCAAPGPCVVRQDFIPKLEALNHELREKRITWEITEMYPPTVPHLDPCHNNGTCVDAKLIAVTTNRLIQFLTAIELYIGTNYTYEVCGSRLNNLRNNPQLSKFRAKFSCPSSTTGESIHIEL